MDKFWVEAGRNEIIRNEFKVNPEDFWELFRTFDTRDHRSAHTRAYHDAERTLRKLKLSGKNISIITGAPHYIAEMEIKKLNGAPHDFYLSITDNNFAQKPHPGSFRHALEKLNSNPSETVYIGNSNEDALYAKNAGVDFIYIKRDEYNFDLGDYATEMVDSLDRLFS